MSKSHREKTEREACVRYTGRAVGEPAASPGARTKQLPSERLLNPFDAGIISFVNSFAHRWFVLDATFALLATNNLIKGGFISAMIWWGWYHREDPRKDREFLCSGIVSGFLALLVARTLAEFLPYRERPILDPGLHFRAPYLSNETLIRWSSFPSDHAALFFALALAIYFVSKRAGIIALCYAFLVICVPRVYMGYHYPTDIIAGAAIGLAAASLGKMSSFRAAVAGPPLQWLERSPALFYTGFFLLTFQIAITFDSLRHIARYALSVARAFLYGAP